MDARYYFVEKNYNCAEAVLRTAADQLGLAVSEDDFTLVSAFGGGMGCGKTCGALCGALAALGRYRVKDKAHATPGFKEECAAFTRLFEEKLGGTDCAELKPRYFEPEIRCLKLVEETVSLLMDFLKA